MQSLRLVNFRTVSAPGTQTLSADFVVGRKAKTVWFRTDEDRICDTADPFIPAALIPAMRRNWQLVVEGEASATLLEGTQRIQETMSGWYPEYHQIPVQVDSTAHSEATGDRPAATFFSGGVDSFYTLQQHRDEISHLIFVHGIDIPLGHKNERLRASDSVRQLAASLGLQLVEVETNLRQFGQTHVSWPNAYCGAALAAVALLLSPRFSRIFVPATVSAAQLEPMGSHPDLDPNWSNETMQLVHDGLHATRFDKVREIGAWQLVHSHLRVCYQRNTTALNCGRCRKCLWTMMLLSASGDLDQLETFAVPLDLDALQLYPPESAWARYYTATLIEEALELLEGRNANPELRAILRAMLDGNGKIPVREKLKRIFARGRTYLAHRLDRD